VIRNAGGDVQKCLPDILAVDTLVRFTDICILRHTGTFHFFFIFCLACMKARSLADDMDRLRDDVLPRRCCAC
jgi:hypothetical protein